MDTSGEAVGIAKTIKKIQTTPSIICEVSIEGNEEIVVRAMGEQESSNKLVRLGVQPDHNTKTLGLLWDAAKRLTPQLLIGDQHFDGTIEVALAASKVKEVSLRPLSILRLELQVTVTDCHLADAAHVPGTAKQPGILNTRHPFTRLLVQHEKTQAGHATNEIVVNELRQRY
ncbi:hypothetical protein EVAR_27407_1 [Eumeta japonica]|uniref:Uncharacterized protein n=1 Tax=Eumeta variegata TaxID=151549 RepID=A0A4C1X0W4_EUMVA|nr:hypothetical protein EVAR_27407_1 [Eumeta japonica]